MVWFRSARSSASKDTVAGRLRTVVRLTSPGLASG